MIPRCNTGWRLFDAWCNAWLRAFDKVNSSLNDWIEYDMALIEYRNHNQTCPQCHARTAEFGSAEPASTGAAHEIKI